MSTEFLCVISANPKYVPAADVLEAALAAFRKMLPTAESADAVVHDKIRFIDPGMRFESVACPFCESELDQIWWGDMMIAAERNGFEDLNVKLPCCDASSTLNNIHYKMPAGFARFLLLASEPRLGRYLTVEKLQALESILGTPVKQVWAQHKKQAQEQVHIYRSMASAVASGRR